MKPKKMLGNRMRKIKKKRNYKRSNLKRGKKKLKRNKRRLKPIKKKARTKRR